MKILSILITFCSIFAFIEEKYRLPKHVTPENYNLTIILPKDVFKTSKFSGIVEMSFEVSQESQDIVLHGNNITISKAVLYQTDGREFEKIDKTTADPESEIIRIKILTMKLLVNRKYRLYLEYEGVLRNEQELSGLYRSSYKENGEIKYLATTQFESISARKAFPCLDEPAFKATFDIRIIHASHLTAISNAKNISTVVNPDDHDTTTTSFATTPKMSTYLVAIVVSEFSCTSGQHSNTHLQYRVCSRRDLQDSRQYALEIAPKIMTAFEQFTGIPYNHSGIAKMDQAAIPDFAAGAMENWGLVTYRENGLLWNPQEDSILDKEGVALTIAHEFGHMWCGNLVTMAWWNDLFLNEGCATYLSYIGVKEVEKSWEYELNFPIKTLQGVLNIDARNDSLALSSFTKKDNTAIIYSKGGSIFRMVEHIIGAENFKIGFNKYLTLNQFDNTEPSDLWSALQNEMMLPSNLPLAQVMDAWIYKPGFPLLNVELDGNNVVISQERFLASGKPKLQEKWYVPITYTTSTDKSRFLNTMPSHWLLPETNLTLTNVTSSDWIIVNNQQTGYYRVNYADVLWDRIALALTKSNHDGIQVVNRAQIVDDLLNLAKIGKLTYARVFSLLEFLRSDVSYHSWFSALQEIDVLWQITEGTKIQEKLAKHILDLMDGVLKTVSFDKSDFNVALKKRLVFTWACKFGYKPYIAVSLEALQSYKDLNIKPDKDIRDVLYCTALTHSDDIKNDFEFLWQKLEESNLTKEPTEIFLAFSCIKSEEVLTEVFKRSFDFSNAIEEEYLVVLFSNINSAGGEKTAFTYLLNNYEKILKQDHGKDLLIKLLNFIKLDQEMIIELERFLKMTDLDKDFVDRVKTVIKKWKMKSVKEEDEVIRIQLEKYYGSL